ncbi:MAG: hypothetical protein IKP95_07780 [Ruminococcus sp.]|nr:hypothetical protein [Ruminococcus sp.]
MKHKKRSKAQKAAAKRAHAQAKANAAQSKNQKPAPEAVKSADKTVSEAAEIITDVAAAEAAESSAPENVKRPRFRLKPKKKYYEVTAADDISYRGFLSYRYLKIIAWVLIVIACLGTVLSIYAYSTGESESYEGIVSVMTYGKELSVPLLLIASFATILNGRGNYIRVLMIYSSVALALAGLFFLIYYRYALNGAEALLQGDRDAAKIAIESLFTGADSNGFFAYNIFIDLTMCTLVMFFVNYNPKRFFKGWKIHLFRSMVLLPIAYEIASICLKVLASTRAITLPIAIFPFLTTKPPVSFLIFIVIARYFKDTEYKFLKHGKTHEDYEAYLKTNHNSFRFSRFLIITLIVFVIVDIMLLIILAALHLLAGGHTDITDEMAVDALGTVMSWGFGQTTGMLTIAPLLLFFSYTKTHKNKLLDIMIPVFSVALIVLIYADGLFQSICELMKNPPAE